MTDLAWLDLTVLTHRLTTWIAVAAVAVPIIIILKRLYFHPLSHVPGPKLAAVTWWYEIYYDVYLPGQYIFKLQELHQKYGPVIRITPNEVHVNDLQYLDVIYAGTSQVRDRAVNGNIDIGDSLAGTVDFYLHKKRRQAIGTFFSKTSVAGLESMIIDKINRMCSTIDRHIGDDSAVNLADLFYGLAWDLVHEYCLGATSNLVDSEADGATIRHDIQTLLQASPVRKHFPWVTLLGRLPFVGRRFIPAGAMQMAKLGQSVSKEVSSVLSDTGNVNKTKKRSIFYSIRDDPGLPPSEKSPQRLTREGVFLFMAGSESPATAMKIILFHILDNPEIHAQVLKEIDTMYLDHEKGSGINKSEDIPLKTLENSLPVLSACITESLRLGFGITVRNARVSPTPLEFGPITIPPRTPVSTTSWAISANPSVFPEPAIFRPSRWLDPGTSPQLKFKYEIAFGKGARKCIGINLAYAEMYLTLVELFRRYDMTLFETDISDVEFQHDYQVAHPKLDSKGVRVKVTTRKGAEKLNTMK